MYKTIIATDISRKAGLTIPPHGKLCYLVIDGTNRVEMAYRNMKTKPGGIVWYFVCPVTGKRCQKLNLVNGKYVHNSFIKGYYRKIKPAWRKGTLMDKLLIQMQGKIEAEKAISSKYFKPFYNGKPTKKYLKCRNKIEAIGNITMSEIINGKFDNLMLKSSI